MAHEPAGGGSLGWHVRPGARVARPSPGTPRDDIGKPQAQNCSASRGALPNDNTMNTADAKRVLETALICTQQPLTVRELRVLFNDELGADTVKELLGELQDDWTQ